MTQAAMGQIACAGCSRSYKWKPELAGKKGKCKCGGFLQFPMDDPSRRGGVAEVAGEYDLNEPVAAPKAKVAAATKVVPGSTACKGCTVMIPPGAVICTRCGLNQTTGKKISTKVKGPDMEAGDVAVVAGKIGLALVLGGITSVVCAIAWLMVIYFTGFEIGWLAIAIGLATGGVIRIFSRDKSTVAGLAAAGFALFALVLVKGLLMLAAMHRGMPASAAFGPFDLLWGGLAAWSGYKVGSRMNQ